MKKKTIAVSLLLALITLAPLQSCIGSFGLTNKVLAWNNQVDSKFVNELVFFAFWILPVYEVTGLCDLLVLNSIEFWSGTNPTEAYQKTIETDHGTYLLASDEHGYDITTPLGESFRLDYDDENDTWSVALENGESYPFMTMVDDSHVRMITPEGDMHVVELSHEGVMAYSEKVNQSKSSLVCYN